jgi:hypothetical protein
MENNNKGIWMSILGLIIIAIVGFLVFQNKGNEATENQNDGLVNETNNTDGSSNNNGDLCYIWNTEAGDKATLKIATSGEIAMGTINWLPAEKDKKTGDFSGTIGLIDDSSNGKVINGLWSTSAEGMDNIEQVKIKFGEDTANVGFGQMIDKGDGTYVYADPENLSYEPTLSKTDCNDSAMAL